MQIYNKISLGFFLLVVGCFSSYIVVATTEREKTLIIGKVSDNPKKHIKRLQPIVDYAAGKLKDLGIENAKVIFAKNNQEMISLIKDGQVDWVTESVYSALQFEQLAQARIFLKRWKKGQADYYSVFITRKDSGIHQLEQLINSKLALEDSGSTSAFFLPVVTLMEKNIPILELPSPRSQAINNKVGYIFACGEINIATWVHKGLADAGVFSNIDWYTEDHMPAAMQKDLRIFYRTESYPRMLELLAPHISRTFQKKLVRILLAAESDSKGIDALQKYQNTTRFELLDDVTKNKLQHARELLPLIEKLP